MPKKNFSRQRKYAQTEKGKRAHKKADRKYYQEHRQQYLEYAKEYQSTIKGHLQCVYANIKQRCINPNCSNYKNYGGRGIRLKFSSPAEFVGYVTNELQVDPRGLEIHRIENDGHYEYGNIEFIALKKHRERHKRGNQLVCPNKI